MNQPYNESTPYINYLSPRPRKRQNCPPESLSNPLRELGSGEIELKPQNPQRVGLIHELTLQ